MARDVFVDHSCEYIDGAIDIANAMKDRAGHAKHELEALAEHMREYLREVDLEENDPKVVDYCIGAMSEVVDYVDDLEFFDEASDIEHDLETTRCINSDLRNDAECYGVDADDYESQVRTLQDVLVDKDKEILALEDRVRRMEEHGQNIKQPEWQYG